MTSKVSLRTARINKGLSVEQVRQLSDIPTGTIYRIEGENSPYKVKYATAELLADAIDCRVDDIDWPNGLSDLGRNPHTGTPLRGRSGAHVDPKFCTTCFTQLPATETGQCDWC